MVKFVFNSSLAKGLEINVWINSNGRRNSLTTFSFTLTRLEGGDSVYGLLSKRRRELTGVHERDAGSVIATRAFRSLRRPLNRNLKNNIRKSKMYRFWISPRNGTQHSF